MTVSLRVTPLSPRHSTSNTREKNDSQVQFGHYRAILMLRA